MSRGKTQNKANELQASLKDTIKVEDNQKRYSIVEALHSLS